MSDYKRGDLVFINYNGPFPIHSYTHYTGGKMYWILGASGDLCGPFFDEDLRPLSAMIANDSYRLPTEDNK